MTVIMNIIKSKMFVNKKKIKELEKIISVQSERLSSLEKQVEFLNYVYNSPLRFEIGEKVFVKFGSDKLYLCTIELGYHRQYDNQFRCTPHKEYQVTTEESIPNYITKNSRGELLRILVNEKDIIIINNLESICPKIKNNVKRNSKK